MQVDGRAFQWSNALAENTIFFVYTITNVSDKDLDSVFFGIYGDPDLGGGSPENTDDNGYFIPPYDSTGAIDQVSRLLAEPGVLLGSGHEGRPRAAARLPRVQVP